MNRDVVVYISGKYSGKDYEEIDNNIKKAREAAIKVWELGYTVFCPHLNTIHFEVDCSCEYEDYLEGDLEFLRRSDVLLLLDNWQDSKGAIREKEEALIAQMPIFYNIEELSSFVSSYVKM